MAIVKMFKFNLFALQSSKKALIDKFQKLEGVQFLDFNEEVAEKFEFLEADDASNEINALNDKISDVNFALKLISEYKEPEKGMKALKEGKKVFTYEELEKSYKSLECGKNIEILKELQKSLNLLGNEKNKLLGDIEALVPWLDLDIGHKDIDPIESCSVEIGTLPLKNAEKFKSEFAEKIEKYHLEEVSSEKGEYKILAIVSNDEKTIFDDILFANSFNKINVKFHEKPAVEIKVFRGRIQEIEKEETEIKIKIKEFDGVEEDFKVAYEFLAAELNKCKSYANFSKTEKVIMMDGWVSEDHKGNFEKVINETCGEYYHLECTEANQEVDIPIQLKGNKFTEAFHSITEMYSLPRYKEIDPTPVLSVFYLIFFGMMLSDAGYGLLMVIGTGVALKVFNLGDATKKFMQLFFYLGISTIVWGLLYGAFFGDILTAKYLGNTGFLNYFNNPLIDSQKDVQSILIGSMVFGVIHVYIGLFMKAYLLFKEKQYMDIIYDVVTWYASVTGLILWLSGISKSIGMILAIGGLVGLLLTQGRDAESIGGKIGGGVYGLYGITGYIGDIVSYSRLMALGLATGSISMAFNSIVALAGQSELFFLLKIVIVLILFIPLHMFNFGINALGTYVHTSRLQYLEFFSKFYEGGGRKFRPLEAEKKYFDVK